jgi:lipoprotein-releasing system permease protein
MYKLFLCLRYIRKGRIAFFAVAAVTLCVALLIVVSSIFIGFISTFRLFLEKEYGQVTLVPRGPMTEYQQLADYLERLDEVQTAKPALFSGGLLYFQRGDVRSVQLVGIDLPRQCRDASFRNGLVFQKDPAVKPSFNLSPEATQAAKAWLEQKKGKPVSESDLNIGVIGGIGLFGQPDEMTDQYDAAGIADDLSRRTVPLILTTVRRSKDRTAPAEIVRYVCWPVDAVRTGFNEADTQFLYMPFDTLKNLLYPPGENGDTRCPAQIQIIAKPGTNLQQLKELIAQQWRIFARQELHWPESRIDDVGIYDFEEDESLQALTYEIRKQLAILQLMVGFICLVAAFLVFAILHMIVLQKKRDIGILRSVGGSRAGLAGIFLAFGLIIGAVGAALGLGLGVVATNHINEIEAVLTKILGVKIWKSGVYMFDRIPSDVAWEQTGWILACGIASAILGAVWPAVRASRQPPVVTLRYE